MNKSDLNNGCTSRESFLKSGYQIIENSNGTVSIYDTNEDPITTHENKMCCEFLGYEFDINSQKCKWGTSNNNSKKVEKCEFKPQILSSIDQGIVGGLAVGVDTEYCCNIHSVFNYTPRVDFSGIIHEGEFDFDNSEPIYEFYWTGRQCRVRDYVVDTNDDIKCPDIPELLFYNLNDNLEESVVNDDISQTCCESYNEFNFITNSIIFSDNPNYNTSTYNNYEFYWDIVGVNGKFCKVRKLSDGVDDTDDDTGGDTDDDTGGDTGGDINCDFEPYKIIINSEDGSGTKFTYDDNETCSLNISFDYLFKYDCSDLEDAITGNVDDKTQVLITQILLDISEKEVEINRLTSLIREFNLNIPPYVIECGDKKYCLTDDGLNAWSTTLSPQTYQIWLNSRGNNINVYGCDDVNSLVNSEPSNVSWYEEDCGFDVYDRFISFNTITEYTQLLRSAQKVLYTLQAELEKITVGVVVNGSCKNYLDVLESFDVSMNLDVTDTQLNQTLSVYTENLFNIGTGNLYNHVNSNSPNTGLMISGNSCDSIIKILNNDIYTQYLINNPPKTKEEEANLEVLLANWYSSCWLRFDLTISDPEIISLIKGRLINISLTVNNSCSDLSILIDKISIDKSCEKVDNIETYISEPPKFEIEKIIDNKKSWVSYDKKDNRGFYLEDRVTEYDVNHHKLVINTKEIDLELKPSSGIETDVWCYINDNPDILGCEINPSGLTGDCCCIGDLIELDINTDIDFYSILDENVPKDFKPIENECLRTEWGISVEVGCEIVYENIFYSGETIPNNPTVPDLYPTNVDYQNELQVIANELGLDYSIDGNIVTFTETIDCDDLLKKGLKIDFKLDIYELDCIPDECTDLTGSVITYIKPD